MTSRELLKEAGDSLSREHPLWCSKIPCSTCDLLARICAHLSSPLPVAKDGYVMVPEEPTTEMVRAGADHVHRWHQGYGATERDVRDVWKALLAAGKEQK